MAANKKAPQDSAGKEPTAPGNDSQNKAAPAEETLVSAHIGVGGGAPGGGPPGEGLHQREVGPNRPR